MLGGSIKFDTLYGVKKIFAMPVVINDLLVKQVIKTKKWKRLNRPSKFKTKVHEIPMVMIAEPPMFSQTTIVCHSKIANQLKLSRKRSTGHQRQLINKLRCNSEMTG